MRDINTFLEKYYQTGDPIILACSGGPDSMFLLYHLLKTPYKHQLVVCYFNHKTRPETDEEEAFLEELGKKEGFKVEIASCDFQKIQSLYPSKSFEELAREKRYAFFDAILHIYKARYIITAHHLDDRIETFFFNLLRGTKLTGLINMTEKNGAILRPLLGIQKQDILSYLEENKLHYFEDATNTDTTITRNYLRHKVLPLFEQVNTHYKGNTEKLIHYFSEMKAYIDEEVERFLQHELSSGANPESLGEVESSLAPGKRDSSTPLRMTQKIGTRSFNLNSFFSLSPFLQKEVIRKLFFDANNSSTIGLSEANIAEILKFISDPNGNTVKEIKNLKLYKKGKKVYF